MAETYSLALKGLPSPGLNNVSNVILPDSAGRQGSHDNAAATGKQILCKNPDGSQSYYKIDAGRSTFANPILRKV